MPRAAGAESRSEQRTVTRKESERTSETEKEKRAREQETTTHRKRSERVLLLAHSRIFFFSHPSTVFTHSSPGLRQSFDMNGISITTKETARTRARHGNNDGEWTRGSQHRRDTQHTYLDRVRADTECAPADGRGERSRSARGPRRLALHTQRALRMALFR